MPVPPAPGSSSHLYTAKEKKVMFVSVGLFLLSLPFKCYCAGDSCTHSFMALALGGFGMLNGGAAIAWLANPLLIASWMITKRVNNASLFVSLGAMLMALSFLLFGQVVTNENGGKQPIGAIETGYWLWFLSTLVMAVLNVILIYRRNLEWNRLGVRKRYR